jgi:uncharacterized repeat protein (TIGR02543 family)
MKKWTRIFTQIALSFLVTFSYLSTDLVTVNASENLQNTVSPETSTENQDTFHIVYDGNGSSIISLPDTESYTIGYIPKVTESIPERTGYVFQEWNTEPDGTGDVYFAKDSLNTIQDMTLYAQWKDQSLIPAEGTIHAQTLKTKYYDYLITVDGSMPEGTELEVNEIVSDTPVKDIIQSSVSDGLTALVYFNTSISLNYNGNNFTTSDDSFKVTITGNIISDELTGTETLYQGTSAEQLKVNSSADLSLNKVVFQMNGACDAAVADITSNPPIEPESTYIEPTNKIISTDTADSTASNSLSKKFSILKTASTDTSYITPYLPAVRDQNPYGACWAFSTIAMIETSIIMHQEDGLKQTTASSIDLSELQLAYFTYHNSGNNDPLNLTDGDTATAGTDFLDIGGNYDMATASAMNWNGAVDESTVPYSDASTVISNGLSDSYQYSLDKYHIKDVNDFVLNYNDSNSLKLAKQYIIDNGSIGIAYYESNAYFNDTSKTYYCGSKTSANHAVSVVGWNDSIVTGASKPGAWLVRNSWGGTSSTDSKSLSHSGYFWLSYYDESLNGNEAYSITASSVDDYDNNYHADGSVSISYVYNYGFLSAANVFTAHADSDLPEQLKAVSIGIASDNLNYALSIYTDLTDYENPESGTLVETQTGNFGESAGYYTIPLNNSVYLLYGEKYSVVFNLSAPTSTDVASVQTEGDNDSTGTLVLKTACEANTSFLSKSTSNYKTWTDMDDNFNANVRIKAYTDTVGTTSVPLQTITVSPSSATLTSVNQTTNLHTSFTPSNTTDSAAVTWSSSNTSVATVNMNGIVTAKANGTAVITAKSIVNSSIKSTSVITVNIPVVQSTATAVPAATAAPTAEPVQTPVVETRDMYRLYNPNSGEHFYTANTDERDYLSSIGWNYEGVGWTAPKTSDTPVYRMYNDNAGEHHYTTSEEERDTLVSAGWIYEGIGWYSGGSVPLYREYNPNAYACNHNYTTSKTENDWLVSLGWNYEGISWYGM